MLKGEWKGRIFVCDQSCYLTKIGCYIYNVFYVSITVTTKQTPVEIHKDKEKAPSLPLRRIINLQRETANEEDRNKGNTKQPENRKIVSPYPSISTLNKNELNSPVKRHRVAECI